MSDRRSRPLVRELEQAAARAARGRPRQRRGRRAGRALRRAGRRDRRRARPRRARGRARRPLQRPGAAALTAVGRLPDRAPAPGRRLPRGASPQRRARHRPARRGDALLAARRRQADPAGAGAGDRRGARPRPRRGAAARRGARDDPHLLADPRRPAGDGRRRPAPRQADLPRGLRRGRRDPRRATGCSPRRCALVLARTRRARRRTCSPRVRELTAAAGVGGMVGGQYLDVTAPADLDAGRAAPPARAEDGPPDRRVGRRASCCSRGADGPATIALRPFCRGARRPVPDRRRHPRRDRRRRGARQAAGLGRAPRQANLRERVRPRSRPRAGRASPTPRPARRSPRPAATPTRSSRIADYILTRQT